MFGEWKMKKGRCIGNGRNASVYEWGNHEVLKLCNEGFTLGNEAENCRIINSIGIPSPEVVRTIKLDGRDGIIFERIDGITMARSIETNKDSLAKYARILAELHVMINSFKVNYPSNLVQELTSKVSYTGRLDSKTKYRINEALAKLPESNEICHYDFHPDNIIMSPKGPVIIDWANVLVGNSLADVTRTSLILGSSALPPGDCPYWLKDRASRLYFHDEYLQDYLKLSNKSKADLEPWIQPIAVARLSEGILEDEQYLMAIIKKI
jgi:tRNA A-37 threonylcarbamoyl transferase component Bud32